MDSWAVGKLIDWAAGKNGTEKTKATLKEELCDVRRRAGRAEPEPGRASARRDRRNGLVRLPDARSPLCGQRLGRRDDASPNPSTAQRRIDRAHRRFLSTLKTLAAVRRLALPALQINVARQQVNQLNAGGSS